MKLRLFLIVAILSLITISSVYADVPTITDLNVTTETNDELITITIRHSGPSANHYVSKIEVKIGEDVETYELEPQSEVTFTVEYTVPIGVVEVRAFCNLHGWSQWVSSEAVEVPIDDEPSGIPGFPLLAVGLGVLGLYVQKIRVQ